MHWDSRFGKWHWLTQGVRSLLLAPRGFPIWAKSVEVGSPDSTAHCLCCCLKIGQWLLSLWHLELQKCSAESLDYGVGAILFCSWNVPILCALLTPSLRCVVERTGVAYVLPDSHSSTVIVRVEGLPSLLLFIPIFLVPVAAHSSS